MEKKPHLFSTKLLKLAFLTVVVVSFRGVSHGHPLDQAGALKALWEARRGKNAVDEEWVVPSLRVDRHPIYGGGRKEEDDLIAGGLPGQPPPFAGSNRFKQYAGYVTMDEVNSRSLFYHFAEAVHLLSSEPIVLWLNGGPGCSSLRAEAMPEMRPSGVNSNGYCIPELADTIVKRNKEEDPSLVIKLKGIMIGNGIMNLGTDDRGIVDYLWNHVLISDETHRGLREQCLKFNGQKCVDVMGRADKEVGDIDAYNI